MPEEDQSIGFSQDSTESQRSWLERRKEVFVTGVHCDTHCGLGIISP